MKLAFGESKPGRQPLLLLGVAMSQLEPHLLQEDKQLKKGDEDSTDRFEDGVKKIQELHAVCC
jgi:hypothetical protein